MPVIIGMGPHKRSATIEVINELGDVIVAGRFGTDQRGYAEMLVAGSRFADRVWAVEAATASASTSRTGWFTAARRCWMCRRSCRRRCGCFADRIPAEDASLDHVISSLALHHVDDKGRIGFARDALRALRPGGRVTVVDFGDPASNADHPAHGHGHGPVHALRHLPRLLRSRVAHSPVVARNHGNGIVTLLTDTGFGDAQEVAHADHTLGRITFVQATRPSS